MIFTAITLAPAHPWRGMTATVAPDATSGAAQLAGRDVTIEAHPVYTGLDGTRYARVSGTTADGRRITVNAPHQVLRVHMDNLS